MKHRFLLLSILYLTVGVACSVMQSSKPQSLPESAVEKSSSSVETKKQKTSKPSKPVRSHAKGYGTYQRQCQQCHALPDPKSVSQKQWDDILPNMSKHAGISKQESALIRSYLLRFKKK